MSNPTTGGPDRPDVNAPGLAARYAFWTVAGFSFFAGLVIWFGLMPVVATRTMGMPSSTARARVMAKC